MKNCFVKKRPEKSLLDGSKLDSFFVVVSLFESFLDSGMQFNLYLGPHLDSMKI